jgi:hypothetical protein
VLGRGLSSKLSLFLTCIKTTRPPAWPRLLCQSREEPTTLVTRTVQLYKPLSLSPVLLYPEHGWRWGECLLCLFPQHVPSSVINLSLPSQCLFIWYLGVGGQTWHVEFQEFEPWVQNSSFNIVLEFTPSIFLLYLLPSFPGIVLTVSIFQLHTCISSIFTIYFLWLSSISLFRLA